MSRRIEIELTSRRDDGSWTWRAAGAREPKGNLDGTLLPDGTGVGDVLKAEADFLIDGIEILAVILAKEKKPGPELLELLGSGSQEPGVTTNLVGKGGRGRRGGEGRGDGGGGRDRKDRTRGDGGKGRGSRGSGERGGGRSGPRTPASGKKGSGDRANSGGGDRGRGQSESAGRERPRAKRLKPGRAHRNEWLASLPEEQRVVAEQVVRGGMAAVRKEIDIQNARATDEGRPQITAEPLIALAEELLPKLRAAEWRDRADAALADIDNIDLRDLRTVVVAADDAARDPEARMIADQLRLGLSSRVEKAQREWLTELTEALSDGRVVRALHVSSRPPKAGAPLPRDLMTRLTDATNEAFVGEVSQHRIGVVLEAVAYSPVRQAVVFENVPASPNDELMGVVKKVSSRLPEIAAKFGIAPAQRRRRGEPKPPPPPPPPEATKTPEPEEPAPAPDPQEALAPEPTPDPQEASAPEPAPAPEEVIAADPAEPDGEESANPD